MARARGANAVLNAVFESTYGVMPGSGFLKLPFVSSNIGEERGLIASDLLGQGRDMQDPTQDVANNAGDIVVPVDVRNIGYWLKLLLGGSVDSGAAAAATGVLTTTANLANTETVTIGGKTYTFQTVLTNVDGNVLVGASAAASITNLYNAINGTGGTPGTDYALSTTAHPTVKATAKTTTTLTVTAIVGGSTGNSIAATETSANASWGGATLAGGSDATHVFTSGASALPSMSIEVGNPDVPSFSTNFGVRANQIKVALQRSGLLNATMSLIAQGETTPAGTSAAGTPTSLLAQRFAQGSGQISLNGAALGSIVAGDFTLSNNLETVETIRPDGRIEDADPAMFSATGSIVAKFKDLTLATLASNGTPVQLSYAWAFNDFTLTFTFPRIFLPKVKRPITGPGSVQATFNWESSGALGHACVVTLVNDVASYA